MHGPDILVAHLSQPGNVTDRRGQQWQYHSRSDVHSKVGCWGVAFDMLATSALLRSHAELGKVIMGVNHLFHDHTSHSKKTLDLVIARPDGSLPKRSETFKSLVERYKIPLNAEQQDLLDTLPDIQCAAAEAVLVALEAKAAMTAHQRAESRLYSELNSSHSITHGNTSQALAIAMLQVNAATDFVSPDLNKRKAEFPIEWSHHTQPKDFVGVLNRMNQLPRRSSTTGTGFDGLGAVIIDFDNDGGPVSRITAPPAPQRREALDYDSMIIRMANEYDSRFHSI